MSKINNLASTAADVLNPLKCQKDFCERAARFASDESRAFETCSRLRSRIRDLEDTLESHVGAAKLFKADGLRGHKNIQDIRDRLSNAKKEYRNRIDEVTRFLSKMDRLEQMALRDLGSIPSYRSIG